MYIYKNPVNGNLHQQWPLFCFLLSFFFLAHLSLYAHKWAYSIGRLRCPSVVVVHHRRTLSSTLFKPLLLRNRLASSKSNFICSLHWMGKRKFVQTVQATWPRWPLSPYMVKTLKKSADDLESWYAALCARVLPSSFKWLSWVDLDLFCSKVKFGPLCFCMGKGKTMDFSETVVVYDIKVRRWGLEFGPLCFCMRKSWMDVSETIVVYDIKVVRCSQLNE